MKVKEEIKYVYAQILQLPIQIPKTPEAVQIILHVSFSPSVKTNTVYSFWIWRLRRLLQLHYS